MQPIDCFKIHPNKSFATKRQERAHAPPNPRYRPCEESRGKGFRKETTSGAYALNPWGPPLQGGFGWVNHLNFPNN